jgi:mono/diheme cytochrome c family protein
VKWSVVSALAAAAFSCACGDSAPRADPTNATQVASGRAIYATHCASCHGATLEGERDWRTRKPNGRMPAPPHDDSGHTWHHGDDVLFGITKFGLRPPYAPPGYVSDMPAFDRTLGDEQIYDVLAYIKSRWSERAQAAQAQISKR